MAGRRGDGRGGLDRDFEIEEIKRQGQELQERLDQRNLPGTEDERSSGSAEDENPFHEDPSQSSNGEDSPHVRSQKIETADKVLTSRLTFQILKAVHNLMSSLIGFILLNEYLI